MYKRRSKGKEGVGKREQVVRGERGKEEKRRRKKRREKEGQELKKKGRFCTRRHLLPFFSTNQLRIEFSVCRSQSEMPPPLSYTTHTPISLFSSPSKWDILDWIALQDWIQMVIVIVRKPSFSHSVYSTRVKGQTPSNRQPKVYFSL